MSRSHFDDDERYIVIDRGSSDVTPFLLGLAIGACAALLLAPQSGEDTRNDIKRRALRIKRRAERAATNVTDTVTETIGEAKRRVEEKIDNVRGEIDLKRRQVHLAMDAGRAAARDARAELEGRLAETKAAYDAGAEVVRSARAARTAANPDDATKA